MPVCQTCGRTWPADHAVCPEDGTRLAMPSQPTVGSLAPALSAQSRSGTGGQGGGSYDDDLEAGSFAGEYQIEKKIGEGGMGAVYGARHPLIGKRAAIKILRRELSSNPEAVDRFVREAQAVNQIGHPNIVDVFSFGTLPDGRSFFAMEWLKGESLRSRLERPLRYAEAIDILDTMSKALVAAHDAGVVHRDLKPDNVFLVDVKDDKPVVMLLDFGLAKLTGTSDGRVERTRTGVVMGTPLYISPEQAKGTTVGPQTDTYALGAMAYEMFTGRCPFLADSAVEIMSLHITQAPVPPTKINPELPAAVDHLVLGMMAKDPQARPTLPHVRKQLAELRGLATSSVPVGSSTAPGQWPVATPMPSTYASGLASTPAPGLASTPTAGGRASSPGIAAGAMSPGSMSPGSMSPGSMSPGSMSPGSMSPGSMSSSALADSSPGARPKRGRSLGIILGVALVLGGAAVAAVVVLGGNKKADNAVGTSNDSVSGSASGTAPVSAPVSGSASRTASGADSASGTVSGTASGSGSLSGSASGTASGSGSLSGSASGTASGSGSLSGSASGTDSASGTASGTDSASGSADETTGSGATKTATTKTATTKTATTKTATTKTATTKANAGGGNPVAKSTAPGKVLIVVAGAPAGGIFVDGKVIGRGIPQAAVMLSPGPHRIRAQAPGFAPQVRTVEVKAGGNQTITVALKRRAGGVNGVLDPFGNDN